MTAERWRADLPPGHLWVARRRHGRIVTVISTAIPEDSAEEYLLLGQAEREWLRGTRGGLMGLPGIIAGLGGWIIDRLRRPSVAAGTAAVVATAAAGAYFLAHIHDHRGHHGPQRRPLAAGPQRVPTAPAPPPSRPSPHRHTPQPRPPGHGRTAGPPPGDVTSPPGGHSPAPTTPSRGSPPTHPVHRPPAPAPTPPSAPISMPPTQPPSPPQPVASHRNYLITVRTRLVSVRVLRQPAR